MKLGEYQIHQGTLFDYSGSCYCGVLVKESTMRKLVRAQNRHTEEVQKILSDANDKGEVFASSWTLHYPDGKQTEVRYIDQNEDVSKRIKLATPLNQPRKMDKVFIVEGSPLSASENAKLAADHHYQSTKGTE